MDKKHLILATDLDGTFLHGSEPFRSMFYQVLQKVQHLFTLVYVTGRPVDVVQSFCTRGGLLFADYLIADHGSHIVDGKTFQEIPALQTNIAQKWIGAKEQITNLLRNESSVQIQPIDPPYRAAYFYDQHQLKPELITTLQQSGFEVILSHDVYLDILPEGVNKGTSLLALLNYLNLPHENAILSGDSMNDLPLFETGLKSIAVANSEIKLLEQANRLNNIFVSQFEGVAGILDGLQFYQKHHLFNEELLLLFNTHLRDKR